jgi:DNA-binding transcriptional LysR family regulator
MFAKLFAESGLSLDRLKALLEVGAAGSIVKAALGDPVRQSQYSRQIKELEDFFRTRLIERQGKGTRLTPNGKELARISRFFMLGLSNFQRGCLAEEQTFHIGASATFIRHFLLPALSDRASQKHGGIYATEVVGDEQVERRLHDLTLDFGVITTTTISRPLQTQILREWKLELWVPAALGFSERRAAEAFKHGQLPLILAKRELESTGVLPLIDFEPRLSCDSFIEATTALTGQRVAALLPGFLAPEKGGRSAFRVRLPGIDSRMFAFRLAWNPRLQRLNPHAVRRREILAEALAEKAHAGERNPT